MKMKKLWGVVLLPNKKYTFCWHIWQLKFIILSKYCSQIFLNKNFKCVVRQMDFCFHQHISSFTSKSLLAMVNCSHLQNLCFPFTCMMSTRSLKMLLVNLTNLHIWERSSGGFNKWRQYFSKMLKAIPTLFNWSSDWKKTTKIFSTSQRYWTPYQLSWTGPATERKQQNSSEMSI